MAQVAPAQYGDKRMLADRGLATKETPINAAYALHAGTPNFQLTETAPQPTTPVL